MIEEGGFSRAGRKLHLTQPAVSQQIRALEAELDLRLLRRTGRAVLPTIAGEILYGYARTVLATLERAQAALAEFRDERRGRLNLGAGNTTITFRLPALLREYLRRHSAIEVTVRSGNSDVLLELLNQGRIDLALVTSPPADTNQFQMRPVFADETVLILPRDHHLCTAASLTVADLAEVPAILFASGSGYRRFLDDAFNRAGYHPEVVMELDSIEGIKRLVQTGLGLSFLHRIAVERELASGELCTRPAAGLMPLTRQTYAVLGKEQYLPAPLRSFLDLLAEHYPAAAPPGPPEEG